MSALLTAMMGFSPGRLGARSFLPLCVLVSVGAHGLAYSRLSAPTTIPPSASPPMSVELAPPPMPTDTVAPPEPAPPPQPEPKRAFPRPDAPPGRTVEETLPAQVEGPVGAEPAPVDLTALTLTSTTRSGAGGVARGVVGGTAPVGARPRQSRAVPKTTETARASPPARVVGLAKLGRRPAPPNLDAALQKNYPATALRSGLSGTAVLRLRIAPTGRVARLQIVTESAPRFGQACQKTLSGSRWTPPEDDAGRRVFTDLTYTCRFAAR